ncbi:MAG: hypothetical protein K9J06_14180, partial [Flavobacteriales bacterium]|nr:hypothetical protein [Flavobacteriales bacterium]
CWTLRAYRTVNAICACRALWANCSISTRWTYSTVRTCRALRAYRTVNTICACWALWANCSISTRWAYCTVSTVRAISTRWTLRAYCTVNTICACRALWADRLNPDDPIKVPELIKVRVIDHKTSGRGNNAVTLQGGKARNEQTLV